MIKKQFSRHKTYHSLMMDRSSWGKTIGIVSCKIIREKQEYNHLWQKVLDFLGNKRFRNEVRKNGWHLAITGGTFDCIPNDIKGFPEFKGRLHGLAPSALGVIQLANLAVYGRLIGVAFFNHMEDLYADSPQNLCLRRICNHFHKPLLEDISSIEYMFGSSNDFPKAALVAKDTFNAQLLQYYGRHRSKDRVISGNDFKSMVPRDRTQETIAVVAHDGKKMAMLNFCLRHADKLLSYRRVISTGTTGAFLRSQMEAYLQIRHTSPRPREWGWVQGENVSNFLARKIQPFESGPRGGDVQISAKVIDGTCHRILFFQDPQSTHPHHVDIRLMEKAVQDPYTAALFATCEMSAEIII